MSKPVSELPYGPVIVTKGKHKGRIGLLDDETTVRGREHGIVRFASFGISPFYSVIPFSSLKQPNTSELFRRHNDLFRLLTAYVNDPLEGKARISALEEINFVEGVLGDRMFAARITQSTRGAKIFLSHSSSDKIFVRGLAIDLKHLGHNIWLDEWNILAGESIPTKIAEGLDQSDFVVLVLSRKSVESRWVETEWQSKYWDEIERSHVLVLPLMIESCTVPTLLKTKKYINFQNDYTEALESLSHAIARHVQLREAPR